MGISFRVGGRSGPRTAFVAVILAAVCTASAYGQAKSEGQPPDIAVIDIAKVFEQYQMTMDLETFFEAQQRSVSDQRDSRRKDLETKRKELEAFVENTPDFKERYNELVRMEVDYQVWLGIQERTLKDEHMRRLRQIYEDVRTAVKGLCEPRGIDVVLTYEQLSQEVPDSGALRQQILLQKVIYASDQVDLTTEVLGALNDAYQKRGGVESLKLGQVFRGLEPIPAAEEGEVAMKSADAKP